jgi:glucan biosynthesis protein
VDFTGGGLDRLPEGAGIEPVVTCSNGQVKDFNAAGAR